MRSGFRELLEPRRDASASLPARDATTPPAASPTAPPGSANSFSYVKRVPPSWAAST